jgi:guanylate kinase
MINSNLLIIIGPSGVGKSSILNDVMENCDDIVVHPTYTTRPIRKNETSKFNEHIFLSDEEFDKLESNNEFIEVVQLFELPYRYGLKKIKAEKGKLNIVMLRQSVMGLMQKHYPEGIVYQIEADYEKVGHRLKQRTRKGDNLGTRLKIYDDEIRKGREIANRIIKNNTTLRVASFDFIDNLNKDFAYLKYGIIE